MHQDSTPHPAQDEPLTLAVHALPDIVNPEFVDAAPSGRGKLLAILFACLLPLLVLYVIFFVARPPEQAAFGVAITPARALPEMTLGDIAGQPVSLPGKQGQWRLLGVGPSRCEDRCVKHLFIQRQLREMLLKKQVQVERLWLLLDDGAVPQQLQPLMAGAQVLRATPKQVQDMLGVAPGEAVSQLFVVDPQGRLQMRMPADQDSAQVRAAMWTLQQLVASQAAAAASEKATGQ